MGKIWTYKEAKEIFPIIKKITQEYYDWANELSREIKEKIMPENKMEELEDELENTLNDWAIKMSEFGIEVKGLWLVDFDNGNGYYCWKVGEDDLLYEHSYEAGFVGRKLISDDEK